MSEDPKLEYRPHYIGAPEFFLLNQACLILAEAFPESFGTYLVGSALKKRDHRDVDVRTILPDAEFAALFPGCMSNAWSHPLWSLMCSSISLHLSRASGLKIGLGPTGSSTLAIEAFAGCELASAAYGASVPPIFGPFKRALFHQYAGNLIARMLKSWAWMGKVYRAGDHVWGSIARAAISAGAAERIAAPGIVDGVEGEVDRDHFYGTVDQLRALTAPPIIA